MLKPVSTSTISSGSTHHLSCRSVVRGTRSPTDSAVATALICTSTSALFVALLATYSRHEWKRHDGQRPDGQEEAEKNPVDRMGERAPTAGMDVVVDQHAQAILAVDDGQKQQQPVVCSPADCLPALGDELVVDDINVVDDVHDQQVTKRQHQQEHARD